MKRIDATVDTTAEFLVFIRSDAPDDVFTRAETEEFQSSLYGDAVSDKDTVLNHWAYNASLNGVDDASRLDGWGDLERGMVTFRVHGHYADVSIFREADEPDPAVA